jgi:fused signal recognition particle receptor
MFGFLKDKLKQAISKFTKDVDDEAEEVEEAPPAVEKPAKKEPVKKEAPKKGKVEARKPVPEKKPAPEKRVKEEGAPEVTVEAAPAGKDDGAEEVPPAPVEAEKKQDEEPPAPEEDDALNGLKESLQSYSDEELDSLVDILMMKGAVKYKPRDEKIAALLAKPLVDINFAVQQLEKSSSADEEGKANAKEEELIEEVEKEEEALEKEEGEGKPGFFKRLFGFGKKKEEEEVKPQEEDSKDRWEEKKEEPGKAPGPEKPKKKEKVKGPGKDAVPEEAPEPEKPKTVDEELAEVDKEEEEVKEEIERDDLELGEEPEEEPEEDGKKGFFGKLTEGFTLKRLSEEKFEGIFFDLEVALLENNVAVEVIEKIKKDLHERLVDKKLKRSQIEDIVLESLKDSMEQILDVKPVDILKRIGDKRKAGQPFVIIFVGINGSGKTTTIAKMARYFMDNNLKTVMVAADTFRAAAIQQLEEHANRLGVRIIKQDYGSDPAAVAFDGIRYAEAKGIDVVLIDTAGRLQSNINLMDEMKKVVRVAKPDMKIFIGESITGNDCVEQAQQFNAAVDIDGIILSKADVDEKGGAAISVSYVTGKPILFIGTGQEYKDLQKFDKKLVLDNLGLA